MPRSDFDDTNRIALWANDRKRTDRDKDYTGNLTAQCPHCNRATEYFAGLWDNGESDDGRRPRFKGSIQPKEAVGGAPRAPAGRAPLRSAGGGGGRPAASGRQYGGSNPPNDLDDPIPFAPQRD